MFTITVPKEFPSDQKLSWTLTRERRHHARAVLHDTDYNITPLKCV